MDTNTTPIIDTERISTDTPSSALELASLEPVALRVCIVGSGWRFTSGISYYTCRLTSELAADRETSAILMRNLVPRRLYPGHLRVGRPMNNIDYPDHVDVFDGVDWYLVPSILRARTFLRTHMPRVVVLQWWTGAVLHSYLAIAEAARSIGAQLIIEFHEIQDTGEARLPGTRTYLRRLGDRLVRRADGFIVHSAFDRDRVRDSFPVQSKPVRVIPHGPFDHLAASSPERTTAMERLDDGRIRVLFFGTIRPYKGLEQLVEAFDDLDDDVAENVQLVVVGETWEGWTLPLELIERCKRKSAITLVNRYVHDDEVADYFQAADVVALPYTRSSASGPLHIAMSYGLPVVLADVGGLREGAAGYGGISWSRPDDVASLKAALIDALSRVGRRYEDPRSWRHTVSQFDELVAEVQARK